ncbi:MAG: hypothetical protein SFU99_20320 [Saprospiraceae bacterium]|nr:hypothetical protein [Saprospiraceae bacterium]
MQNSQLILILKSFSKKELRELRKWLDSPAHNQREDVIQLFEYLTWGDYLDNERYLKKEKIFSKIFPNEPFDDAKLRQTMHFLLKATEDFLLWQEYQEDPVQMRITLAGVYRKRKLNKVFLKTVRLSEELQEKSAYRNEAYLRNEYLLQQEKYMFHEGKEHTTKRMNLQEVSDALDMTFIAEKLRQSCLMLAHQAVYRADYQMRFLKELIEYVHNSDLMQVPSIAIYYYSYRMLSERDNPMYFEELKKQIEQNGHLFPNSETQVIYVAAINYCIGRLNLGEEKYFREAFELYRRGLEEKILIQNDTIDPYTFTNVSAISLKLKEFKWLDHFIHNFKDYLEAQHRENFFQFNLARLRYEQKDYDAAMRLLAQTDFDDILINLNAKVMLFKMYYELEEIDAMESLLVSMRAYLQRKKIMGYGRSNYQNFIRYSAKLLRVSPYNSAQKDKLRQQISSADRVAERDWLLKQLEAL